MSSFNNLEEKLFVPNTWILRRTYEGDGKTVVTQQRVLAEAVGDIPGTDEVFLIPGTDAVRLLTGNELPERGGRRWGTAYEQLGIKPHGSYFIVDTPHGSYIGKCGSTKGVGVLKHPIPDNKYTRMKLTELGITPNLRYQPFEALPVLNTHPKRAGILGTTFGIMVCGLLALALIGCSVPVASQSIFS